MSEQAQATMDTFFTRQAAEDGTDVSLFHPVTGEDSGHKIRIRGTDSTAFRRAEAIAKRRIAEFCSDPANKDEQKIAEYLEEQRKELVASLVISWTLKEPCTPENILRLFGNAPQIQDSINLLSSKRQLFLAQSSSNSTTTQEQK